MIVESRLIKTFTIPPNVMKQAAKYTHLELYTDKLVGIGSRNGNITYFFKNYIGVQWTPASVATQFAQIVFITRENASNYVYASNLTSLNDMNKIPFCSGMFSYAEANNYAKSVYLEIKAAMDEFQSQQSNESSSTVIQSNVSAADELIKFKNLLDMGVITQEEFDMKKQQLLYGDSNTPPTTPGNTAQQATSYNTQQPATPPVAQPAPTQPKPALFCTKCGFKRVDNGPFCVNCGNRIE